MFDFLKKLDLNGGSKLSWLQVLILGLVPLGQLWARIFIFNGSLDKWWLMFPLFLIPPFSFISIILMKYGYVANGKGANPLDYWMILPIVAKFIIPFILPIVIDEDSEILFEIVSTILQMLTIMTANLARRQMNCFNITTDSVGKASIDSVIAYGVGEISTLIIPWIPFIGTFISILGMIPVIGEMVDNILWVIGFVTAYVLINMFNQEISIKEFCSTPFTGNMRDKIPFMVSLISILVLKAYNLFSPI